MFFSANCDIKNHPCPCSFNCEMYALEKSVKQGNNWVCELCLVVFVGSNLYLGGSCLQKTLQNIFFCTCIAIQPFCIAVCYMYFNTNWINYSLVLKKTFCTSSAALHWLCLLTDIVPATGAYKIFKAMVHEWKQKWYIYLFLATIETMVRWNTCKAMKNIQRNFLPHGCCVHCNCADCRMSTGEILCGFVENLLVPLTRQLLPLSLSEHQISSSERNVT